MTDSETRTEAFLRQEVAAQLFTLGAQVSVRRFGAPVIDLAMGTSGLDRPVRPDTVFRVYCTIKPILAVAVASHVSVGRIDLDAPLADLLERPTRLPSRSPHERS